VTEEEARKLQQEMAERGIEVGQWFSTGGGVLRHNTVDNQKVLLTQLRDLLEQQMDSDLKQLDQALRQLEQAKHGGGR